MEDVESSFIASLENLGASVSQTDVEGFQDRIEEAVTRPAVGTPLHERSADLGLSLAETSVEVDPTPTALRNATTGVTEAELGVSDYGSLSLSMTERASELVSLFVEKHVAVLHSDAIVDEMETMIQSLSDDFERTRGSSIIATGPSATADMGALVKGAHGPKEVHVIIIEGAN